MTTARLMQRLLKGENYGALYQQVAQTRPEASLRAQGALSLPAAATAMALIRLDELGQAHVPLASQLIRDLVHRQEADDGWVDPMTTALCLRALMCSGGDGLTIERGLGYLADLQKTEGLWPRIPIRRMDADPFVSAFILLELGRDERFAAAVNLPAALSWFRQNYLSLDGETRRLWDQVARRQATISYVAGLS